MIGKIEGSKLPYKKNAKVLKLAEEMAEKTLNNVFESLNQVRGIMINYMGHIEGKNAFENDDVILRLLLIMMHYRKTEEILYLFNNNTTVRKVVLDSSNCIMYTAVSKGLAEFFVTLGAKVTAITSKATTVMSAVRHAREETLAFLLAQEGIKSVLNYVNKDGLTALMEAAIHGKVEAVTLLLRAGSDADMKSTAGLKAVDYAKKYGRNECELVLNAAASKSL